MRLRHVLMAIVVASYRQTVRAYAQSGGAYIVAKENLGKIPSLVAAAALRERPPLSKERAERFGDLGGLLLTSMLLWAYLSFSEFLIVWSVHLPREAGPYAARLAGK